MRKWNKLLAMVLAMVMVFGLTATAFAEENEDADEGIMPISETGETTPAGDAEPAEGEDAAEPDAAPAEGEDAAEPDAAPADEPDAAAFSDVSESDWFYEAVMAMAGQEVVGGYPDGRFLPNDSVTWGAALKMVIVLVTKEEKAPVEGGDWASGYVAYAKAEGILDGDVDINAAISRAEVCQVLAKTMKIDASEEESVFPDTDDGYVLALFAMGVINGNPDGTFDPDGNLTRAAMCTILAALPASEEAPAEGEDAAEPDEAEDEGDDAAEPAEGEGAGDEAGEPAEGDEADEPDAGEAEDGEPTNELAE